MTTTTPVAMSTSLRATALPKLVNRECRRDRA